MFKHINYKVLSFWIISFSILTILTLPVLIQDGMFMDAVQYTAISRNMSIGFGNFWYPQLSYLNVAELPAFHEQPPLGFGIMAIFFKFFATPLRFFQNRLKKTRSLFCHSTTIASQALRFHLWHKSISIVDSYSFLL